MAEPKIFNRIGHHGAGLLLPPGNTLEAINLGIDAGSDMIEVDVRSTRDEVLVLAHSAVRGVKGRDVAIRLHTLSEWNSFMDEECQDPPLVTLEAALNTMLTRNVGALLDLKDTGIENLLARLIRKAGFPIPNIMIAAPTDASKTVLRSLDPRLAIAHKIEPTDLTVFSPKLITEITTEAVFWPPQLFNKERVLKLRARKIITYAGPVTSPSEMRRLRDECNVDGIVSEYPDVLSTI